MNNLSNGSKNCTISFKTGKDDFSVGKRIASDLNINPSFLAALGYKVVLDVLLELESELKGLGYNLHDYWRFRKKLSFRAATMNFNAIMENMSPETKILYEVLISQAENNKKIQQEKYLERREHFLMNEKEVENG